MIRKTKRKIKGKRCNILEKEKNEKDNEVVKEKRVCFKKVEKKLGWKVKGERDGGE